METLAHQEPLSKPLQVSVTKEAAKRIRVYAALHESSPGRVISDLALEHLPAAPLPGNENA